jgi:hypothetical protein
LAYSLIGTAFGLTAFFLGKRLVSRTPTEWQVEEGMSLRRFRLQATGLHLAIAAAMVFASWRLSGGHTDLGNDAPVSSMITFFMVQTALGWPWSKLGSMPTPDRPDAARV